jgi:septation ring formation regulator EzrA
MARRIVLGSALTAALLMGAACGGSVTDAAQQLCTDLTALDSTVDQIGGSVDPATVTVGDVQEGLSQLESQVTAVQDSEANLGDEVKSALRSAFDEFQGAVADIPADSTLEEAGADVEQARTEFQQAWTSVLSELNCESSG